MKRSELASGQTIPSARHRSYTVDSFIIDTVDTQKWKGIGRGIF